jgi:phenylacetate-CoA ligase
MEEVQLKKFKALILHCYTNVPFYRKYMLSNGINPNDITSLSDLKAFLIITKETIKENYEDFTQVNIKMIRNVKKGQTGGTTGSVLHKRTDAATRSSTWAAYKRFYDWRGVKESDKNILIKGGHITKQTIIAEIKTRTIDKIKNTIRLDAYDSSKDNVYRLISYFFLKVALIDGYSQSLFEVAKKIEKRELSFNIKAIMATAETLMPKYRTKKLIITDLDNFAMPYYRY